MFKQLGIIIHAINKSYEQVDQPGVITESAIIQQRFLRPIKTVEPRHKLYR